MNDSSSNEHEPSVEVFAVYGVEPEIQAYAMAKYSRSSLSMKESLKEITSQKAEKFLNTFYFQYGHRSIADLAHIALAIERLSISGRMLRRRGFTGRRLINCLPTTRNCRRRCLSIFGALRRSLPT